MSARPRFSAILPTLVVLAMGVACTTTSRTAPSNPGEPASRLITAEEIQRSGATNAWDALRRNGTHLRMRETPAGRPTQLQSRGRSSLFLSQQPLVVVDGTRMVDFTALHDIPARTISHIRILSGVEGTARYGTGAGNGVIVVSTRSGGAHPIR